MSQATSAGDNAQAVLEFWLGDAVRQPERIAERKALWFEASEATDRLIESRYGATVAAASRGELDHWAEHPRSRLGLVIVLDQFRRNLFRGTPQAYACDPKALALAEQGIARADERALLPLERAFLYMPLQHSESAAAQAQSVASFERLLASLPAQARHWYLDFLHHARLHRDIVVRFGRFPHRNAILGRSSTPEESAWLERGGPRFGQ